MDLHLTIDSTQWTLAIVAALFIGISKAGLKGISIIIVTLMALVLGGKQSSGSILPLLLLGDCLRLYTTVSMSYGNT